MYARSLAAPRHLHGNAGTTDRWLIAVIAVPYQEYSLSCVEGILYCNGKVYNHSGVERYSVSKVFVVVRIQTSPLDESIMERFCG